MPLVFLLNPSWADGGFSRTHGSFLFPFWHPRALHQMFICLRVKRETECRLNQRGQRGPRAESRACYVLARSLCFHCHRVSSAQSSNVFFPARYDDSSRVDFSHSSHVLFALPLFVSIARGLTEKLLLDFPLIYPVLLMSYPTQRAALLGLMPARSPLSFAGALEVLDSDLTDFAISLEKPSGCHGTCGYRIRPFTWRLTHREVEIAELWLEYDRSAHFPPVLSLAPLLSILFRELKENFLKMSSRKYLTISQKTN